MAGSGYGNTIVGQPLVRDHDGVRRFTVNMSQNQPIGIDDPIPTGD
jgi:hypothetical protein